LAELRFSGQDLDVWPDFAAEMSSRKLFFLATHPAIPSKRPGPIHIALA
jgi:hypothetical protein